MFAKGRVVRVDVFAAGFGLRAAWSRDTEDKIKELLRRPDQDEPHHYLPETGHYLNYSPANSAERGYGMVFETEDGKITSFRAGTRRAIALVEGCS